jgi:hypothetical protein
MTHDHDTKRNGAVTDRLREHRPNRSNTTGNVLPPPLRCRLDADR